MPGIKRIKLTKPTPFLTSRRTSNCCRIPVSWKLTTSKMQDLTSLFLWQLPIHQHVLALVTISNRSIASNFSLAVLCWPLIPLKPPESIWVTKLPVSPFKVRCEKNKLGPKNWAPCKVLAFFGANTSTSLPKRLLKSLKLHSITSALDGTENDEASANTLNKEKHPQPPPVFNSYHSHAVGFKHNHPSLAFIAKWTTKARNHHATSDLFHWLHEVGQTRGKEVEMCCEGTWKFAQHGDDVWQKDKWLRSEKGPKIWIWSIPGSKLWVSVGATRHINILIYSDSPRPKCIKILETLWMFSPNPVHRYCWFVSHHSGVQRWQVPKAKWHLYASSWRPSDHSVRQWTRHPHPAPTSSWWSWYHPTKERNV